jgi:hypothetical protein
MGLRGRKVGLRTESERMYNKLHDLYFTTNIIHVMKLSRIR